MGEPPFNSTNLKSNRVRLWTVVAVVIALLILVGLAVGLYFLAQNEATTRNVRDILLIVLALEFMVLGAALIVLLVQIARLTLLLQIEIKPLLESANETVNSLKGTTVFLSENLVEPVIQLNSSLAGIRRLLEVFRLFRG
ncbi:MAG: hypothetical protein ABSF61_02700 [Anaerolineales bacterium]